jgi:hypothetical protein
MAWTAASIRKTTVVATMKLVTRSRSNAAKLNCTDPKE